MRTGSALFFALGLASAFGPRPAGAADDATVKVIAHGPKGDRVAVRRETPIPWEGEGPEPGPPPIAVDVVRCADGRADERFAITTPAAHDRKTRGRNWRRAKGWLERHRFTLLVGKGAEPATTPMASESYGLDWPLPEAAWPKGADSASIVVRQRRKDSLRIELVYHPIDAQDTTEVALHTAKLGAATYDRCRAGLTPKNRCLYVVCTIVSGAIGNSDTLFVVPGDALSEGPRPNP